MCQFIESIKIENSEIFLLDFHQKRMSETLSFFKGKNLDIFRILEQIDYPNKGLYKLRITYDLLGNFSSEIELYSRNKITDFQLINNINIHYSHKYKNRESLEKTKQLSNAEEIIITQNEMITDTSFSNLVFLKNGEWHTPKTFLLNGVQRQYSLANQEITETDISTKNLTEFSHFKLINAMNNLEESIIYPIETIINLY
ncbi:MAG: aminotransferase class IV [Bergeyella zoohelcum]|nr:aminotransferase class IV [Bergeyella zoohelcum]